MAAVVLAGLMTLAAEAGSATQVAMAGPMVKGADPVDLETQARNLFPNPKRYGEAARLLLKAAERRSPGDPARIGDLILSSRLTYYNGDAARARALMERAADEALASGDVINAAHSFMDAAFLAQDAKESESITRLIGKARMLAASPFISQKDREGILGRLPAQDDSR
jgi:hypothetical protein